MKHNWEYKKLGEICESINGLWTGKNPPFVNIGVIRNTNFTKSCTLDTSNIFYTNVEKKAFNKRKLKLGDIIVEKSGGSEKQPVGRPVLFNLGGPFSFSNFTATLRLTDPNISSAFLHKVLSSFYFFGRTRKMQKRTTGLFNLNWKLYLNQLIPVPPREEQERIVAELDKINEVIEECRELLRTLDALAQSLFYHFFGDPVTNPKGWETSRFGELCKLSAGGDKPFDTQKEISKDFNIPIYSNGIENEGLYGYTSKPRITSPAITISGRGTLGVPFIRLKPFVPIIRLIVAIPSPVVNLTFLFYMIKLLKIGGKGAAIPQLTVPMVKDLLLPVPPLELQEKFAARIEQIEEQKKSVEQTIAELQTLLDSRMDYWFN